MLGLPGPDGTQPQGFSLPSPERPLAPPSLQCLQSSPVLKGTQQVKKAEHKVGTLLRFLPSGIRLICCLREQ